MTRHLARALATIAAVALPVAGVAATPAHAAGSSASKKVTTTLYVDGAVAGYPGVLNGRAAQLFEMRTSGGQKVRAYCIDPLVDIDTGATFKPMAYSAVGNVSAGALARAAWIGLYSPQTGTPLSDANLEAVAVQLAIWKVTAGQDYSSVPNYQARDRATALLAAAPANPPIITEGPSMKISASVVDGDGQDTVKVKVTDAGRPVSGAKVRFIAGGFLGNVTTNAAGVASAKIDDTMGTAKVTVSRALPPGMVLNPSSGQRVITIGSLRQTGSVKVGLRRAAPAPSKVITPAPAPAPAPAPKPAPAPSPTATKPAPSTPAASPEPEPSMDVIASMAAVPAEEEAAGPAGAPVGLMLLLGLVALLLLGAAAWLLVRGDGREE